MSSYLIAVFIAWLGAHIIKYIVNVIRDKKHTFIEQLFMSGGMPSSHSATAVALATVVGLRDGFETGLFGLATLLSLIHI